ncbi:MAG: hypothetical protein ACE5FQ_14315 [Thiogranum sp.]
MRPIILAVLLSAGVAVADTAVQTGVVAETGLRYWEWNGQGVLFRLTQRLPDQTRAYLMARGFRPDVADRIATRCVFQSMFKNTADTGEAAVAIDLDDWRIHADDGEQRLITRDRWQRELQGRDISQAAAIALEWSLLPTRQVYAPGDYNWGMSSYGLQPGALFDLDFSWTREDRVFEGRLNGVECAPDIHPEPQS